MKDGTFLFVSTTLTILTGAEFFVILTTIKPADATSYVLWLLFTCQFVFTTFITGFIWHKIKRMAFRSIRVSRWISLRQSALFSLVITTSLFLKSLGILSLWDLIPLAVSAVLVEFFCEADKHPPRHELTR